MSAERLDQLLARRRDQDGRIDAEVRLDGATITDDVDLSQYRFAKWVSCRDATFEGRAGFGGCQFNGGASFEGTTFRRPAAFAGAGFQKQAAFTRASFAGPGIFTGARFPDADFAHARFEDVATFRGATFARSGQFAGAQFTRRADFSQTTWAAVDFAGATFGGPVAFDHAETSRAPVFDGASGAEAPSSSNAPAFGKVLRRAFWVTPRARNLDGETDRTGFTLSWDFAVQFLQLLGAAAALVAWVVVVGGAIMWARLDAAAVPNPIRAVTLLPRDALVAQGIRALAVPLMTGAVLALATYLALTIPWLNAAARGAVNGAVRWATHSGRSVARSRPGDFVGERIWNPVRVRARWATHGWRRLLWLVPLAAAVLLVFALADWADLRLQWVSVLFVAIVLVVVLGGLAIARRPSQLAVAAIVFATVAVIGGTIEYLGERADDTPEFEPASVVLKGGRTLTGLLLARTDKNIGLICGQYRAQRSVAIVPTSDAVYVGIRRAVNLEDVDPKHHKKGTVALACGPIPLVTKGSGRGSTPPQDERLPIEALDGTTVSKKDPPGSPTGKQGTTTSQSSSTASGAQKQTQSQTTEVKVPEPKVIKVPEVHTVTQTEVVKVPEVHTITQPKVVKVPEIHTVTQTNVVTVPGFAPPAPPPPPRNAPSGGRPSDRKLQPDRKGIFFFKTSQFSVPVTGVIQLITVRHFPKSGWSEPKRVKLGTKAFRTDADSGALVRFRLSPFARRLVVDGAIRVEARVTARDGDGLAVTRTHRLHMARLPA